MSGNDIFPHKPFIEVSPFTVKVAEAELTAFYDLLRLSKLGPRTYENTSANGKFGVTYDWMSKAKEHWQNVFDW
jgi:microsomal epoxide hydrolase